MSLHGSCAHHVGITGHCANSNAKDIVLLWPDRREGKYHRYGLASAVIQTEPGAGGHRKALPKASSAAAAVSRPHPRPTCQLLLAHKAFL
jgi:hypothetical protein